MTHERHERPRIKKPAQLGGRGSSGATAPRRGHGGGFARVGNSPTTGQPGPETGPPAERPERRRVGAAARSPECGRRLLGGRSSIQWGYSSIALRMGPGSWAKRQRFYAGKRQCFGLADQTGAQQKIPLRPEAMDRSRLQLARLSRYRQSIPIARGASLTFGFIPVVPMRYTMANGPLPERGNHLSRMIRTAK